MRLGELIAGLEVRADAWHGGGLCPAWPDVEIADLCERSGDARAGTLFVARVGTRVDGRGLIPEVVRRGASAVLVEGDGTLAIPREEIGSAVLLRTGNLARATALLGERFFGEPGRRLRLIGITGTNGKTTVAHGVRHVLREGGIACGLIGTVETDTGAEVRASSLTTPFAIDISRDLRAMVDAGCSACVMEVSSHALAQGRCDALRFEVGVYTNLSGDHLDYHGTMDAYARAKAGLFSRVTGAAILNADDAYAGVMEGAIRGGVRIVRCGQGWDADVRTVRAGLSGMDLELRGPVGIARVRSEMIGAHNAMNLLQIAYCAHEMGVGDGVIARAIESFVGARGRLERVGESPAVFVDFAHTDAALAAVIASLRGAMDGTDGRLIVVFGCGGDRDRTKRPRMGRAACSADVAIVTSDNPRSEDPLAIIEQVREGMDGREIVEADRRRAIERAIAMARAGDVVLIAGKGHEREQILPDGRGGVVRTAFDDAGVAREALAARGGAIGGRGSVRARTGEDMEHCGMDMCGMEGCGMEHA